MDDRNDVKELRPQPDPMPNEGPPSNARNLTVAAAIAGVLLAVMYGATAYRAEVKDGERQSEMQRDTTPASTQPAQPLPGGRTTAGAPTSPGATRPGG